MDDYIKRKDAICYAQWEGAYKAVINIEELPPEDVRPVKHGKWLARYEGDIYEFSECSECGNTASCETPYCAQCGARMDGVQNESQN